MIARKTMTPAVVGLVWLSANLAVAQPAQMTFGPVAQARSDAKPGRPIDPVLGEILRKELSRDVDEDMKKSTLVRWAETPLPSGAREVVVYISGGGPASLGEMGGWCGTGGCSIDIFERRGAEYRKIGDIQGWLPVRLLAQTHDGHPDLSIWVQGGGVYPGYASRIVCHAGHYPMDGIPPFDRKIPAKMGTRLLDDHRAGTKLYP